MNELDINLDDLKSMGSIRASKVFDIESSIAEPLEDVNSKVLKVIPDN